jgi:SepF-like predicted cell division protein (DUF552 family)
MHHAKRTERLSEMPGRRKPSEYLRVSPLPRPIDYLELERTALAEYLSIAEEMPLRSIEIWQGMADVIEEFNAQLREMGEEELLVTPCLEFLTMVQKRLGSRASVDMPE